MHRRSSDIFDRHFPSPFPFRGNPRRLSRGYHREMPLSPETRRYVILRGIRLVAARARHPMVFFCVTRRRQMARVARFLLTESTAHEKMPQEKTLSFTVICTLKIFERVSLWSHILKVRFARRSDLLYLLIYTRDKPLTKTFVHTISTILDRNFRALINHEITLLNRYSTNLYINI